MKKDFVCRHQRLRLFFTGEFSRHIEIKILKKKLIGFQALDKSG